MFDDLFNTFGDDQRFQEIIKKTLEKMILDINNDVKYNNRSLDDDLVKATLLMCFHNTVSFEFIRTLNMAMNGADEVAFGNVNEFINKLEVMYKEADMMKDEYAVKKYGGM